jgi:hypothetical protein
VSFLCQGTSHNVENGNIFCDVLGTAFHSSDRRKYSGSLLLDLEGEGTKFANNYRGPRLLSRGGGRKFANNYRGPQLLSRGGGVSLLIIIGDPDY